MGLCSHGHLEFHRKRDSDSTIMKWQNYDIAITKKCDMVKIWKFIAVSSSYYMIAFFFCNRGIVLSKIAFKVGKALYDEKIYLTKISIFHTTFNDTKTCFKL